ncbi:helix-turn-helix domain-containing protein [Clostridium tunisiense]|uniref:helix-turn-helix domain-containing protein n=1 Tax=Clostridium tunisiense TaxID=219748 RepID=UPI0006ACBEE1|nr:helix-turn-helix transcriptional regulator [Clostridium tunisiense]
MLGKRIKNAREIKKLTQEKLAEIIGVSTVYISHLEIGSKTPSLETLIKISNVLEVSIDYLLANNLNTSVDYLKGDLAKILNSCSAKDISLILAVAKAIIEHNKDN